MVQQEINQLMNEINQAAGRTEFNTMTLLDGSLSRKTFNSIAPTGAALPLISIAPFYLAHDIVHNPDYIYYRDDWAFPPSVDGNITEVTTMYGNVNTAQNSELARFNIAAGTQSASLTLFIPHTGDRPLNLIVVAPDGRRFGLGGDFFGSIAANTPIPSPGNLSTVNNLGGFAGIVSWNSTSVPGGTNFTLFMHSISAAGAGAWRIFAESNNTSVTDDLNIRLELRRTAHESLITDPPVNGGGWPQPPPPPPPPPPLTGGGQRPGGRMLWFQLGANANQGISVGINGVTTAHLGALSGNGSDLRTRINVVHAGGEEISRLLNYIDAALTHVTAERAYLGAVQNRLEFTARSLAIASENLLDSESRIRNADLAREMMNFTKLRILQQASVSMLAQANAGVDAVLQLLR